MKDRPDSTLSKSIKDSPLLLTVADSREGRISRFPHSRLVEDKPQSPATEDRGGEPHIIGFGGVLDTDHD